MSSSISGVRTFWILVGAGRTTAAIVAILVGGAGVQLAVAQQAPTQVDSQHNEDPLQEIVVTAQKREQNVNSVPMSITAATGEQLKLAGVQSVNDLPKIAPGLTFAESSTGTAVYSLRGVGYNDVGLSARPAVTVYLDEAPIPFAQETNGAAFDLERVEVLKGPQGTLFGNNSTGGAINFIAAKPTSSFEAGGTLTYGRFNENDAEGYVSGPISDTLRGRLAIEHRGMNEWQQDYLRDDRLGKEDFTNARGILDWKPTDSLQAQMTVSAWLDRSDTQATQAIALTPSVPALLPATGLAGYPLAPANDRAADWNPGLDYARNNNLIQAATRIDYELPSNLTITSLTNFLQYHQYLPNDNDGTAIANMSTIDHGTDTSISQELRISMRRDRLNGVAGLVYSNDHPIEEFDVYIPESTLGYSFEAPPTNVHLSSLGLAKDERISTYAAFGNIDYRILPKLTLLGGARFTDTRDDFSGCNRDTGDGTAAIGGRNLLDAIRAGLGLAPVAPILPGQCFNYDRTLEPGLVVSRLDENNVSWRGGVDLSPSDSTLLYANVSKGYKSGGYPTVNGFVSASLDPATQESVLAYEAGFKQRTELFDRPIQLNGAAFYYDYSDKQVTGTIVDPVLGPIAKLVNVPKSSIYGTEFQLTASLVQGLTINASGTYLKSQILRHYKSFNQLGELQDFNGITLPNAPQWQFTGSVRYERPINEKLRGFVGSNASYQSRSYVSVGTLPLNQINAYSLVDFQAGLQAADDSWRAYLWSRNTFNSYYWYDSAHLLDTYSRIAGKPATFGVTMEFKFR